MVKLDSLELARRLQKAAAEPIEIVKGPDGRYWLMPPDEATKMVPRYELIEPEVTFDAGPFGGVLKAVRQVTVE
ncbi:MAG: hypothetical protein ACYC2Y_10485 [Armatimonadota bacterium]